MTAIIFNLQSHAASEYDWAFNSVTGKHAGADGGLMALGGGDDAGAPITAEAMTPLGQHKSSLKKAVAMVYVSTPKPVVQQLQALVTLGTGNTFSYPLQEQDSGVARARPGRGINENYLGFGVRNEAGADFEIERIEVQINVAASRRV